MNPLAKELNASLEGSVVLRLLSENGKNMYFPRGIVAQSAEAKQKANRLNATIGMACLDRKALELPLLKDMLPGLSEAEAVSYAPTAGVPKLRELWKEQQYLRNPGLKGKESTSPVVVSGLTSGIFQMAELFINPGDRVIIPDMFWGNYRLIISERRQGIIDSFPFFSNEGGFNIEGFVEQLAASSAASQEGGKSGKVIILLNFPNNPTGYSPSISEGKAIRDAVLATAESGTDILTVHDDAYFGLFYEDDTRKESLYSDFADLHENILALKVDGATKEEFAWGFRVGFMSFAAKGMTTADFTPLIQKLMGSIRGTVSNSAGLSQHLLVHMLTHPDYPEQKAAAGKDLERRYKTVRSILDAAYQGAVGETLSSILTPLPFNSGYFMAFRTLQISAEELRLALLDKGIGTIAIGTEYLRVAFAAVDNEDLDLLYREIFATARELHG